MKGYIYSLHTKTEDEVFYVGATVNPNGRVTSHRCRYPYYKFDCRIGISIIEEIEIERWDDLKMHEQYWIQQFVAWGFELQNYNLYYGFDVRRLQSLMELEFESKYGEIAYKERECKWAAKKIKPFEAKKHKTQDELIKLGWL
jgi:hypothetical protein